MTFVLSRTGERIVKTVCFFVSSLALACLLSAGPAASPSDADAKYDTEQLYREVRQIVRRHYPEATSHRLDDKIHFEHDTRIFIIHDPLKTGEWQDPREVRGPKKGGIYGEIELRQGRWEGPRVVPQSFDKRYFTHLLMAPYSEKLDAHLVAHIKYPRQVPDDFLKQLTGVLNQFERYVQHDAG